MYMKYMYYIKYCELLLYCTLNHDAITLSLIINVSQTLNSSNIFIPTKYKGLCKRDGEGGIESEKYMYMYS